MGLVAAVAAVAAVVSAYAQIKQGEQANAVAKYNAKMAGREAEMKRQQAAAAAEDARQRHERTLAAQRARYGASGVTQEGSPLLVMLDSEEEAALDIARIRHSGREAGTMLDAESKMLRYQGKNARQAGYLNAGASLLSGAASAYGAYSRSQASSTPITAREEQYQTR